MFPAALGRLSAAVALILTLWATPSSALLVQPIFLDMRYSGIGSNAALQVVNDRNRPVTVEVTVSSIELPERGPAVFTPIEGEDFLIFPSVATIAPNATQIFRVRWIGDPALAEGKMFALTSSELPVEMEADASAAVQLLYAIQSIVAIGPSRAQAELTPVEVERGTDNKGAVGVSVMFENTGTLHGQVSAAAINVSTDGWSRQLTPAEVSNAVGLGLVPAGGRRAMFLPIPDVPAEGTLSVTASIPRTPLR